MNKGKSKLKSKYFLVGVGVAVLACYFSFSLSIGEATIEFDNVEALAGEEQIDPTKYCKKAGGTCLFPGLIVRGLQIEDKVE